MVRCSRSGMGKLPNGFCVVFTVWRLLAIHVSGIFHHDMFIMFILFWQVVAEKYWIQKNVCLEIWAPAASKGKSPQYHFSSVCEKEEGQSNYTRAHCSCEFHSWTPGTSNICFFPAKFWKLQSVCAHVIPTWACLHNILHLIFNLLSSFMPYIIITTIIFSCWAFLVSWLGLWGVPCIWLQVFAKGCGGWKNPVKFVRKLSQLTKRDKLFWTF